MKKMKRCLAIFLFAIILCGALSSNASAYVKNGYVLSSPTYVGIYSYNQNGNIINDSTAVISSSKEGAIGILVQKGSTLHLIVSMFYPAWVYHIHRAPLFVYW